MTVLTVFGSSGSLFKDSSDSSIRCLSELSRSEETTVLTVLTLMTVLKPRVLARPLTLVILLLLS